MPRAGSLTAVRVLCFCFLLPSFLRCSSSSLHQQALSPALQGTLQSLFIQLQFRLAPAPLQATVTQARHGCNLHPRTVGAWADSATTIYQQHLVPTPTNFRGLANSSRPAVVLLRSPLRSAHALCERTRLETTKNPPGGGHTTSAQRKLWKELRAAPQGDPTLRRNFDAFEAFADGWRGHAAAMAPSERAPLVITYEQLQAEGRAAVLARVLAFWRLEPGGTFEEEKTYAKGRYVHQRSDECEKLLRSIEPGRPSSSPPPRGSAPPPPPPPRESPPPPPAAASAPPPPRGRYFLAALASFAFVECVAQMRARPRVVS